MEKISTSQGVGSKRKGEKRERQFESVGRCVCVCALVQKCIYGPWARQKKNLYCGCVLVLVCKCILNLWVEVYKECAHQLSIL